MLQLVRIAFACLLLFAFNARCGTVALVLSDNSRPYSEFQAALGDVLGEGNWRITSYAAEAINGQAIAADLVVTAGSEALRRMLARGVSQPLVATLLPRHGYEKILAESSTPPRKITAIYLDQPPARQAAFIRHLLPEARRIGMLAGSETRPGLGRFRQALVNRGLTLEAEDSDSEATLLPALNTLLPRIDLLLASPDTTIYRRGNVKAILITAFRHQKPLVGYSEAFTQAGALASLYSTPAQIARQTAGLLLAAPANWPAASAPTLFTLSINYSVAQSLGLKIPEEATIRHTLLGEGEAR